MMLISTADAPPPATSKSIVLQSFTKYRTISRRRVVLYSYIQVNRKER